MKVKSESEVTQSCPTLSDPMDCNLPGSSIHGICQARVLEWGATAFSDVASTACIFLTDVLVFFKGGFGIFSKLKQATLVYSYFFLEDLGFPWWHSG